ncbi:hypothetical protein [Terracidiphilus gabretensis]|uniref:hypothetical protein n=1 Tax=Terracidiphilus gabretensis TaxID=1577687 RepID=UPI00071BF2CB|nr:hypothetical protein [Terracidiphilus gabretensis]
MLRVSFSMLTAAVVLSLAGAGALSEAGARPAPSNHPSAIAGAEATTSGMTGYTQSGVSLGFGNTIPMGHEWVTRMAAVELLGYTPASMPDLPDPKDPRKKWTQGKAKNLSLNTLGAQDVVRSIKSEIYNDDRYLSRYKAIYAAIVGERWVDIAGYNVASKYIGLKDCWSAVAQEAEELQEDHFMRKNDSQGGQGSVDAAKEGRRRFIQYFVNAAMAPPTIMNVYDGGAAGSISVDVDRNFFLFGRALHLFEDSFSSEHVVRLDTDSYTKVRSIKSYLCAPGSEVHEHSISKILNYTSGDVIWKPGTGIDSSWNAYRPSNMKKDPLVASEATKDAWAAFIRTMGYPMEQRQAIATSEAETLANNWLSYDENEMTHWYDKASNRNESYVLMAGETGTGQSVDQCMQKNVGTTDKVGYMNNIKKEQRTCIYNAIPWPGYDDLYDTSLHMYYTWQWRSGSGYDTPPVDWQIPNRPADTGARVQIQSVSTGQYMVAPDGLQADAWVYLKSGIAPLDFIVLGPKEKSYFRLAKNPRLFLSYRASDGAVKLYDFGTSEPSDYTLAPAGPGSWSIKQIYWQQYMYVYLSTMSPYIDSNGDPKKGNGQWVMQGLPQ